LSIRLVDACRTAPSMTPDEEEANR